MRQVSWMTVDEDEACDRCGCEVGPLGEVYLLDGKRLAYCTVCDPLNESPNPYYRDRAY